jgi:3-oxoacyl-[acyl-carrier protein] reductase
MGSLEGKSALVTGGSRGIGRAVVERLARDGAVVTFSYVQAADAAQSVVGAVTAAGGSAQAVPCDLGDGAAIGRLFDAAEEFGGGLDIVVNNAGVVHTGLIVDTSDEQYDQVMGANAKGTFRSLREAARRVRDGGRIVNVSTLNTRLSGAGIALYAAGKAAVERFTVVAAHELGPRGITVNAVSPGATDTDMLRGANSEEVLAQMATMSPLGRLGTPADVADVVAFLVGPDGRWLTGQNLRATGGLGS